MIHRTLGVCVLQVGESPSSFELLNQDGAPVSWSSFRGCPVVVFFYPKANTPGCTKEACGFSDLSGEFAAINTKIIGISADTVKRQSNFVNKYGLKMPLLSDLEHTILEPWGVWAEKKNYGRTYMGIVRTTVLFDQNGEVVKIWSPVRVKGHVQEVLESATELAASTSTGD